MKKKIISLMLAAAMVISMMASCSITIGSSKDDETSSADDTSSISITTDDDTSGDDTSSEEVSNSTPVNVDDIDIADKWDSWQIAVDGDVYTIPCDLSEFKKNGWELKNSDGTLKSNQYTLIGQTLKKGDLSISAQLVNMTDNEVAIADCQVGSVKVTLDDNVSAVLPGGIVFDKNLTVEDVKAKYGEPDDITESEKSVTLTYDGGYYMEVEFCFYNEDSGMKEYSYVLVENFGVK